MDELKDLSKNLKTTRPVQKIISSYLDEKWDIIEEKLGDKVDPKQLYQFAVSLVNVSVLTVINDMFTIYFYVVICKVSYTLTM